MTAEHLIKTFNSIEEYVPFIRESFAADYDRENHYDSWSGDSLDTALGYLEQGNFTDCENDINNILDQMKVEGLLSSGVPLPQAHYYGSRVNVSAYLHGRPKAMYRRVRADNSSMNTPLSIYVETTVSAGVSNTAIKNRGIALCAFILAMSAVRPVEMYTVSSVFDSRAYGRQRWLAVCTKICSRTVDTGRVMYALTSNAYARRVGLGVTNFMAGYVRYTSHGVPSTDAEVKFIREQLNLGHEDIYIKGGHLYDNLMLTNPTKWVRDMVEKHKELVE